MLTLQDRALLNGAHKTPFTVRVRQSRTAKQRELWVGGKCAMPSLRKGMPMSSGDGELSCVLMGKAVASRPLMSATVPRKSGSPVGVQARM